MLSGSFLKKLKREIGIEGESGEKLAGQPDFVIKELEEPAGLQADQAEKEVIRSVKPKKAKKGYPEPSRRVKVEEKLFEPKIEIQKGEEKEKIEKKKWFEPEGQLTVDVYQTDGELVIQSAIAGVRPEDLGITVQDDVVIIRGKRDKPAEKKERNYFYQECYWGPFSREIILPLEADATRAEASMVDGVLTIRMPKIEREKEKKIIIKDNMK